MLTAASLGRAERGAAELHLLRVPRLQSREAGLERLLSADERARAGRFRRDADRLAFVAARAVLRRLLGARVGVDPRELVFDYNVHGKPSLPIAPGLRFNLSHTEGAVAIALSQGIDVGVDIERVLPERASLDGASLCFADSERAALARCPAARRYELFFALWTLNEAYLKARGEGLSLPLDGFAFELASDGAAIRFQSSLGDEPAHWRFHRGLTPSGHAWALALRADHDVALEVSEA